MPDEKLVPDAVLIPTEWKTGTNGLNRANELLDHAERILATDRRAGQQAHVRLADGSHHFCTHSPHDTLFFPKTHARSGKPRYRWETQQDESVHGFLVDDEARAATGPIKRENLGLYGVVAR